MRNRLLRIKQLFEAIPELDLEKALITSEALR